MHRNVNLLGLHHITWQSHFLHHLQHFPHFIHSLSLFFPCNLPNISHPFSLPSLPRQCFSRAIAPTPISHFPYQIKTIQQYSLCVQKVSTQSDPRCTPRPRCTTPTIHLLCRRTVSEEYTCSTMSHQRAGRDADLSKVLDFHHSLKIYLSRPRCFILDRRSCCTYI